MKKIISIIFLLCVVLVTHAQLYQVYRIYAGYDYKDFIGTFANPYNSNSIFNNYSQYGNEYSSKSIWNQYSTYGNEYNSYSPWNEYSTQPPVLIDENNKIVDYFSCSYKASDAMRKFVLYMKKNYNEIAKDPNKFYDYYFK